MGGVLGSKGGVAASDVIRSMLRLGFAPDDIYDVLVGIGLPGEQVQLLIDRVRADFRDANLEPLPSRLAEEVGRVFKAELEDVRRELSERAGSLAREQQLVRNELEKLRSAIVELHIAVERGSGSGKLRTKWRRASSSRRSLKLEPGAGGRGP